MQFIKNIWYVAAWDYEVEAGKAAARTIAGEPVALFRDSKGKIFALEDRCPHRHAPLSLGRIEGDELRCMYHGLKFAKSGQCTHLPAANAPPANMNVRSFPVVEKSGWIWIWLGAPDKADPALIPDAWGIDNPAYKMETGALDYAADYQLINDNLCDLSHVDYVHETTLKAASGAPWSQELPKITTLDNGIRVARWMIAHPIAPENPMRVDTFSTYDYLLPGLFIMRSSSFPAGTAQTFAFGPPKGDPMFERLEQQAVTPIAPGRSRYLFASGLPARFVDMPILQGVFDVIKAAFAEDKRMIEGQQAIWDRTAPGRAKVHIPQDTGPSMFRRMILRKLREESEQEAANPAGSLRTESVSTHAT